MRITMPAITVEDQERALAFYTGVLGFTKKADLAMGGDYRWLTVASPHGPEGVELVLETAACPPAQASQKVRYHAGLAALALTTRNIDADYERLRARGVRFRNELQSVGPMIAVVFEDGCGNLINLIQPRT